MNNLQLLNNPLINQCIQEIKEKGIESLNGRTFDPDTLQNALEILGYKKGHVGAHFWYQNIIDKWGTYIAHLEAISPEGMFVSVVILSHGNPYIIGIQESSI